FSPTRTTLKLVRLKFALKDAGAQVQPLFNAVSVTELLARLTYRYSALSVHFCQNAYSSPPPQGPPVAILLDDPAKHVEKLWQSKPIVAPRGTPLSTEKPVAELLVKLALFSTRP